MQYSARSHSPVFGRQTLPVAFSCRAERDTDGDVPTTEITLTHNEPEAESDSVWLYGNTISTGVTLLIYSRADIVSITYLAVVAALPLCTLGSSVKFARSGIAAGILALL